MPGSPSSAHRSPLALPGIVLAWVLLAIAASAHFVFETAVVPSVADPALVFGGAVASALFLLLIGDRPRMADLRALGGQRAALALGAGVLGLAVAPALVMVNRYSDAPAGTVVAFWTTAVWGLLLVAASALSARRPVRAAGALVAMVGCMGILGSWERPSSFSLLVTFPAEELTFVIAGVAWAAFVIITGGLARTEGARGVYALAAAGGLAGSVAWGVPASGWDVIALVPPATALPAVVLAGLVAALSVHLSRRAGAHLPGAALLAVPVLVTTLLAVERATGTFGPRPIILDEAAWGSAVAAAGISVALLNLGRPGRTPARPVLIVAGLAAAGLLAVAVYSLFEPGVAVAVRGTTLAGSAFAADFTLAGLRTVGGWLALAVALLAVAAWIERPGRLAAAVALLAGITVAAAHATLRFTPLQTWMTWIPAEIQHDYGTEYASIIFAPVSTNLQVMGIMGACVVLAGLLVWRSLSRRGAVLPSDSSAGGRDR
ncbi:MAG: hypothetical protein ACNA76_09475 [Anaerosomatales bacterium]